LTGILREIDRVIIIPDHVLAALKNLVLEEACIALESGRYSHCGSSWHLTILAHRLSFCAILGGERAVPTLFCDGDVCGLEARDQKQADTDVLSGSHSLQSP